MIPSTKYWLIVASKNHVQRGVDAGFAQACHGKASPLQRMNPGDWVIYYSPKLEFEGKEKCQTFTAIGKVVGEMVYPFDMGGGFVPFRRDVEFRACHETPISPLIPELSFIRDKKNWGHVFRFGFFKIPQNDFDLISSQMLTANQMGVPNP